MSIDINSQTLKLIRAVRVTLATPSRFSLFNLISYLLSADANLSRERRDDIGQTNKTDDRQMIDHQLLVQRQGEHTDRRQDSCVIGAQK